MKILGIDPGTGICGFGVIEVSKASAKALDFGVISTPPHTPLPKRLADIYDSLHQIIQQNQPDIVSIENYFSAKYHHWHFRRRSQRRLFISRPTTQPAYFEYTPTKLKRLSLVMVRLANSNARNGATSPKTPHHPQTRWRRRRSCHRHHPLARSPPHAICLTLAFFVKLG